MKKTVLFIFFFLVSKNLSADTSGWGISSGDNLIGLSITGYLFDNRTCTINSNDKITVVWSDLITMQMDGNNYKQNIITSFTCNSEATVKLKVTGVGAGFNGKILKTNHDNVGIKFYHNDTAIDINKDFSYTWSASSAPPVIMVSPVASNTLLNKKAEFSAQASLLVAFE